MTRGGYIYIVSNTSRSVLYIGVTSNLYKRAYQHKSGEGSIFSSRFKCTDLVYFEFFPTIMEAIQREKKLKKWKRKWKEELIKSLNPNYDDLFDQIKKMQ